MRFKLSKGFTGDLSGIQLTVAFFNPAPMPFVALTAAPSSSCPQADGGRQGRGHECIRDRSPEQVS